MPKCKGTTIMPIPDILSIQTYLLDNAKQAVRTVLHENAKTHLVLWQLPQGSTLPPHRHPNGTDIWIVLQGELVLLDDEHTRRVVRAGQNVVVAPHLLHGAINEQAQDCVLLSVVPADAGFQPA